MFVRDLVDGQELDRVLLVRDVRRNGDGVRLSLADRTGTVTAVLPDGHGKSSADARDESSAGARDESSAGTAAAAAVGAPVRVTGRYDGSELIVAALRPAAPEEVDLDALLDGPPRSAAQMEADLRELVATVQDRHLRTLLDRVLGPDSPTWPAYRDAPAAKRYHQAYRHGLLEHSLGVAQAVSAISATFAGIDRDVAIAGALLHDVGKLDAYTADPLAIDMTDAGKLQGEIPLGYYRIRRAIEDIPGFPPARAAAVLHIILSHHGTLEHGSPVVPCTREATLVHQIDNLGGRLGSFDRIEKALPDGSAWSGYDRALGGGAYFADRHAA